MSELVDQALQSLLAYETPLKHEGVGVYVSENELSRRARARPKRSVSLVGKKVGQETGYFHLNAWMLGEFALELEALERDHAIAVLFRDADGTRSTSAGIWAIKRRSMVDGFRRAGFSRGVPMLPMPKSEAWLLALCEPSVANVATLESRSGNDASAHSLKSQLTIARQGRVTAEEIRDWLAEAKVDFARLDALPSFKCFHDSLHDAVALLRQAAKSTSSAGSAASAAPSQLR
jgi:hypothetical protein